MIVGGGKGAWGCGWRVGGSGAARLTVHGEAQELRRRGNLRHTAEMEIVARAKGSPTMLPILTPRRPYCLLFSILRRDGEWSEP